MLVDWGHRTTLISSPDKLSLETTSESLHQLIIISMPVKLLMSFLPCYRGGMRGWSVDRDGEQQQMNNRGWTDGGGGREQNGGRWDRRGEQRWDGGRGGGSRGSIISSSPPTFPVSRGVLSFCYTATSLFCSISLCCWPFLYFSSSAFHRYVFTQFVVLPLVSPFYRCCFVSPFYRCCWSFITLLYDCFRYFFHCSVAFFSTFLPLASLRSCFTQSSHLSCGLPRFLQCLISTYVHE